MQITHFRNQLHIHCKKALIITVLLFSVLRASAQYNIYEDDLRYLQRNFHFGISLAANSANYKITLDSNYLTQNEILEAHAVSNPGFSLGILSDYHISRSFELRFIPDLSFSDRSIQYKLSTTDNIPVKTIQ